MFLYGFSELPIVFNGCLTTCLDLSESFSWLLQYFRNLFELDGYLFHVDIQVFCCTNGIAPLFFPYVPRYSFSTALCFMANLKIPREESDYGRFLWIQSDQCSKILIKKNRSSCPMLESSSLFVMIHS